MILLWKKPKKMRKEGEDIGRNTAMTREQGYLQKGVFRETRKAKEKNLLVPQ